MVLLTCQILQTTIELTLTRASSICEEVAKRFNVSNECVRLVDTDGNIIGRDDLLSLDQKIHFGIIPVRCNLHNYESCECCVSSATNSDAASPEEGVSESSSEEIPTASLSSNEENLV